MASEKGDFAVNDQREEAYTDGIDEACRQVNEYLSDAGTDFRFVNAGLNVFFREDENWMLLTWGDVSHLAPGAASEGDDP